MKILARNFYRAALLAVATLSVSSIAKASSQQPQTGDLADPVHGKTVYERCKACHSLSRNRTGPKHCGLFGRKAGTINGFDYSDAMRNSNLIWNQKTLDAFLTSPFKTIPGTTMGYGGVWNIKDRADLIAYLKKASMSEECS